MTKPKTDVEKSQRGLTLIKIVVWTLAVAVVVIGLLQWRAHEKALQIKAKRDHQISTLQQHVAQGQSLGQQVKKACADPTQALGLPSAICVKASQVAAQPTVATTPGPSGAAGQNGLNGVSGPQGPQGPQGSPGPSGPPGPSGDSGTPGTDGQNGANGTPGANGNQGPAGVDGAAGAAGQDGKDGTNGVDGADGQPPVSWTYTDALGVVYECDRTDPFDKTNPTYTCAVQPVPINTPTGAPPS